MVLKVLVQSLQITLQTFHLGKTKRSDIFLHLWDFKLWFNLLAFIEAVVMSDSLDLFNCYLTLIFYNLFYMSVSSKRFIGLCKGEYPSSSK